MLPIEKEKVKQTTKSIMETLDEQFKDGGVYTNHKERRVLTLQLRKFVKQYGLHIPNPELDSLELVNSFIVFLVTFIFFIILIPFFNHTII